jgi:SlyX protein
MDEKRTIELETKIAHQEIAIEELQKNLNEQSMLIDKLEKGFKLIKERMEAVGPVLPPNEKPPHY